MARTYLERHLDTFEGCSRDELIQHALRALKESLSQDKELMADNTSVGVGGINEDFKLYENQEVVPWLESTFENKAEGDGGDAMHVDS
jgi:20S proteasome subunit alpha 6